MEARADIKQRNGFKVLLDYPEFLKVWSGRTISRFGDALDSIAFMWLMYKLTGSTMLMGTVMAVSAIPSMFGIFAGVLVDRMDKKKVMIVMDLLRGLSTLTIALLFMMDALEIWQLYAFSFFNSVCEIFSVPARSSAMQVLVRKEHYLTANSLNQASGATAEILGMGIAAGIIGLYGAGVALLVDAVTFLISAFTAFIASMERVVNNNGKLNFSKFIAELHEGLNVIKSNSLILINIILGAFINILLAPFNVLMPIYSDKILKAGEQGYSLMGTAIMVGTIIGSIITGQIGHKFKKSTIRTGGFMIFGACVAALGFISNLFLALVVSTLSGACLTVIISTGMTVVQEHTPKEKMGRVVSVINTIALIGMPLGFAASGVVGQRLDVQLTYMIIGAIMIIICIPPLLNKEFRNS